MFDLKIGFSCNNNCVHCVVADKRPSGNLDIPHLMKVIEKIPCNEPVQITGGEPTVYSYLPSLLKTCREMGHETFIQTNGTGFSDSSFLEECAPYINHIHIAIHSCSAEVHDRIVQSKGMWDKTMQGWANIRAKGIECSTQTVLSKYNINTLYDTFDFIQKVAPGTQMSMTYPHFMGNAYRNREEVAFRYKDYADEIQKTLKKFKDNVFVEAIPLCYLHPYTDVCRQDGVILQGAIRDGVDFSSSLDKVNYNMLDLKDHRKGPLCKRCIYNDECIGVWKEYIEMFGNKLDLFPIEEE